MSVEAVPPTPGKVVRLRGWRGIYRVHGFTPDGYVTVWGGTANRFGMRTVEVAKLRPARRGDIVPGFPSAFGAPASVRGRR